MDDISIQYAERSDLPALADLAQIIWWKVYPDIISEDQIKYMLDRGYDLAVLEAEMDAGVLFPLLWRERTLIGLASFGPQPGGREAKLHKLYLDPDHHGQGLGSRLLNWIEDEAEARNFSGIMLQVNKQNTRAITAYRRRGFQVRDEIVVDIGNGYVMDDYLMGKLFQPMNTG